MATYVFHACGVYLNSIEPAANNGERRLMTFWADSPATLNNAANLLVTIDLSKTVAAFYRSPAAKPISRAEIQYDDGRVALNLEKGTGGIYILRDYWRRAMVGSRVVWPLRPTGRTYEYQEAMTIADPPGNFPAMPKVRYRGFHARLVGTPTATVNLQVAHGGQSLDSAITDEQRYVSINDIPIQDFKTWTRFYPKNDENLTQFDPLNSSAHEGALFIEETAWKGWGLTIPKLPPGQGGE